MIGTQGSAFRNLPVSRDLNIDGGDFVRLRKFVISFVMDNVSIIHLCIINLGKAVMYRDTWLSKQPSILKFRKIKSTNKIVYQSKCFIVTSELPCWLFL